MMAWYQGQMMTTGAIITVLRFDVGFLTPKMTLIASETQYSFYLNHPI